MITPEIQEYVASCRTYGMSDKEIGDSLIATGWQPAQVASLFAQPTLEVASLFSGPPVAKKMGLKRTMISLLVVLLAFGATAGVVSAAEMGYLPAVSRVYRKTAVPLAWKGTTDDASLAMARALVATEQVKSSKIETKVSLDFDFSTTPINTFVSQHTTAQPDGEEGRQLAAVSNSETLHVDFALKALRAENGDVSFTLDWPLKDLQGLDALEPYLKEGSSTLSLASFLPANGKAWYLRSVSLPTPTLADLGKWFKFSLPEEYLNTTQQEEKTRQLLSEQEDIQVLRKLINKSTVDKGIVRKNGEVRAWYVTEFTRDFLAQQAENPELPEEWREDLRTAAPQLEKGSFKIDWFMTPSQPILREMTLAFTSSNSGGQYSGTIEVKISEATSAEVGSEPDSSKTWLNYEQYMGALKAAYPNLYDTGIFNEEAIKMFLPPDEVEVPVEDGEAL